MLPSRSGISFSGKHTAFVVLKRVECCNHYSGRNVCNINMQLLLTQLAVSACIVFNLIKIVDLGIGGGGYEVVCS